jgi:uncharacterized protein
MNKTAQSEPAECHSISVNLSDEQITQQVSHWLSKIVIGLNLCPFAKAPFNKGQIKFLVTHADSDDALVKVLSDALNQLAETPVSETETTILIVPNWLQSFDDYNQFLDLADDVIVANELEGILQVASFHPNYQFAETDPDAAENYSNRSPFPLLHLLREDSVSKALESEQDADDIVARNIATLNALGVEKIKGLLK